MENQILLGQVRRKLNVTWNDTETDARLEEIIANAIPDLKHKLGIVEEDFDFSIAGAENSLFLAYCLYDWEHSLQEFDLNYERMIAQVRSQHLVKNYVASEETIE